ncbi:potassium-transporting ATPase subunit KdpC [uncultured Paludibaculum sp.]|uniref:potassium-transporting ATPase subunit KdpC n=1 Tax=uncultured Paludibaculum sp. TaxID=1765020 RepID=UPI002AAC159F|nr:potassium-transporting ATPase subunit KdpC [uncultured Paludibaculum sp.]
MWKQLLPGLRLTLVLTALTGLAYPGIVTPLCQVLFPRQANGSLLSINGRVVGSSLIGQNFSKPGYFHPRPSAAGSDGYDAAASSGSNLGATSQKLVDRVKASADQFHKENPGYTEPIPADILTASGSGLDPHITPAAALAQAARVASARGVGVEQVNALIDQTTEGRDLGILGEPRVNVLALNMAMDQKFPPAK